MAKTVNIPDDLYNRLQTQARASGLNVEAFLADLIKTLAEPSERAFVEHLRAKGLLVSFAPVTELIPDDFKPVTVHGKPVSETIIEDRE